MSVDGGVARRRPRAWLSASARVAALTMMPASRPKGGSAGFLPLGDLALVEALGVARDDRAHDRMVGLVGLQQAEALLAGAAGAAGDLAQELEGALGGARVAVGEAEIGVDHADQRHVGEVVALGDELRADDDVGLAIGDGFQFQPQPLDAAEQVGGEHDRARIREMRRRPLPPRARRPARRRRDGRTVPHSGQASGRFS